MSKAFGRLLHCQHCKHSQIMKMLEIWLTLKILTVLKIQKKGEIMRGDKKTNSLNE